MALLTHVWIQSTPRSLCLFTGSIPTTPSLSAGLSPEGQIQGPQRDRFDTPGTSDPAMDPWDSWDSGAHGTAGISTKGRHLDPLPAFTVPVEPGRERAFEPRSASYQLWHSPLLSLLSLTAKQVPYYL